MCEDAIKAVPVRGKDDTNNNDNSLPPPANLSKSVASLTDLSAFESASVDVITCCYGYNLIDENDMPEALAEAYRVLKPTGILMVVNWERSSLHSIGRDVLTGVKRGAADDFLDANDSLFLHSQATEAPDAIALSSGTPAAILFARALEQVGFLPTIHDTTGTYPFQLGAMRNPLLIFFMGTIVVRDELMELGALKSDADAGAGGWSCLAEQIFWTNMQKCSTPDDNDNKGDKENQEGNDQDKPFWIYGNQCKMTIVRKS